MQKTQTFFKWIDIFGTPAKLRTFGEDSYRTAFGGLLTLISVVLITVFTYMFGTDFYFRENPRVVQQDKIRKQSTAYLLSTAKDPFMIKIVDPQLRGVNYQTLPYKISGNYAHFKKNETGAWVLIFVETDPLVPCTQTKVTENKEIAESVVLADWYCFDWDYITEQGKKTLKDPNYKAQLMGTLDENERTLFRMDVRNYRWKRETNEYYDISTMDDIAKAGGFGVTVKYPSAFFDADDEQGLQVNYKEEVFSLNRNQLYSSRQDMKRLIVRDDRHWMLKDIKEEISLKPDEATSEYQPTDLVTKRFQSFYVKIFYNSKNEQIVNRSYMKAQELAAIIGGLIKSVVFNCAIIIYFYSGFYMMVFYITKFFENSKPADVPFKPVNLSASVSGLVEESVMGKAKRAIEEARFNFFSYYFCCKRRQSIEQQEAINAFKSAEKYIESRLDVKYLLKHFERFESLVDMILTQDQKEKLFN